MSLCRHELGGSTPQPPPAIPTLIASLFKCDISYLSRGAEFLVCHGQLAAAAVTATGFLAGAFRVTRGLLWHQQPLQKPEQGVAS